MNAPKLIIMCGIPRSGKSTRIQKYRENYIIVSPDEIRKEVFGHQFHAPANKFVFGIAESMVSILLSQGKNVVIDATHITANSRSSWKDISQKHNANVTVEWVYAHEQMPNNLLVCLERNRLSAEDKKLPIEAMERMALLFEVPDPQLEGEWFNLSKYQSPFERDFLSEQRIKIPENDTIEGVIKQWRLLWHVVDIKENDL